MVSIIINKSMFCVSDGRAVLCLQTLRLCASNLYISTL